MYSIQIRVVGSNEWESFRALRFATKREAIETAKILVNPPHADVRVIYEKVVEPKIVWPKK